MSLVVDRLICYNALSAETGPFDAWDGMVSVSAGTEYVSSNARLNSPTTAPRSPLVVSTGRLEYSSNRFLTASGGAIFMIAPFFGIVI